MQDKQRLWHFFAHASLIVGMMIVVFFLIDAINPALGFSQSPMSRWLTLLLALLAIGDGLYSAVLLYHRQKQRERKRALAQKLTQTTTALSHRDTSEIEQQKDHPRHGG